MEDQQKLWGFMIGAIVGIPLTAVLLFLFQWAFLITPISASIISAALVGVAVGFIGGYAVHAIRAKRRNK